MTHFLIAARESVDGAGGSITHLRLFGEFDMVAREPLRQALLRAVGDGMHVVIELDKADFLDSESLCALVEGYQAAKTAGLRFVLAGARGTVRRVLEVTGVLDFR